MPAEILSSINKCFDIYSCVIAFFIIFSVYLNNKNRTKIDSLFALTCFANLIFALSDCLAIYYEFNNTQTNWFLLRFFNFTYSFCSIFIYNSYLFFIFEFLKVENREKKILTKLNISICVLFTIGIIISQFVPFYYYFDENNNYHRGNFFFVTLIFQFILLIVAIYVTFSRKKIIPKNLKLAFTSFMFIPVIFQVIQVAFYGISLVTSGITLSFFIIFINLNKNLEKEVKDTQEKISNKEEKIISIQNNTIMSLSNLVENRDSDTGNHVKRTSIYVNLLATKAKEKNLFPELITDEYIKLITDAAPLHDIGKIVVPDYILKKPGKLSDEEFDLMKKHTTEGYRIVNEILSEGHNKNYVKLATEIATYHHEKWNGTGYPKKLAGEAIPLSARIMAIADVFDALVSPRCYKPPFPTEKAFQILQDDAGLHFDPILVPLFIELKQEILQVMNEYGSDLCF